MVEIGPTPHFGLARPLCINKHQYDCLSIRTSTLVDGRADTGKGKNEGVVPDSVEANVLRVVYVGIQ